MFIACCDGMNTKKFLPCDFVYCTIDFYITMIALKSIVLPGDILLVVFLVYAFCKFPSASLLAFLTFQSCLQLSFKFGVLGFELVI